MFVTSGQFYIFFACISISCLLGVIWSVVCGIKYFFKNIFVKIFLDILCFVLGLIIYEIISYKLGFPSLRFYMILGVFLGLILYLKSFNIILANMAKKLYNITRRKYFTSKKGNSDDRR